MNSKFKIDGKPYVLLDFAHHSEDPKNVLFVFTSKDNSDFLRAENLVGKYAYKNSDFHSLDLDMVYGLNDIYMTSAKNLANFMVNNSSIKSLDSFVSKPVDFGTYRHYKSTNNKHDYALIGSGLNIDTSTEMILYRALYNGEFGENTLWARPREMFFEDVNVPEFNYSGPRFRLISKFK